MNIAARPMPKLMKVLLFSYCAFYVLDHILTQFAGVPVVRYLGLIPRLAVEQGFVWQFLTYSLLHGGLTHLLLNALALWMLGTELLILWGRREFIKFYVICVLGASLTNVIFAYFLAPLILGPADKEMMLNIPVVGASGAIYGLLAAYAIFFGEQIIYVMFLFPMKAKYFALILFLLSLWQTFMERSGEIASGVAHSAHLGGMVAGFLYLYFKTKHKLRRQTHVTSERDKLKSRFRVIVNQNFNQPTERDEDKPSDPKRWN